MFSDIAAAGAPPDQWDALPTAAKLQFLGFIGPVRRVRGRRRDGAAALRAGGKPGTSRRFIKSASACRTRCRFDLYDPFGLFKMTPARRSAGC